MTAPSIPPITVLVVEDAALVRMNIVLELEDAGYRVCEAANADIALNLIAQESVSVLFTDVDMPGSMNGLQLAALVRQRLPCMPIIVTSGHIAVAAEQLPSAGVFLTKPYLTFQVVAAIKRLLG
ncbi:MAG: response regulator [Paracoccaceae bacterium]